MSSSSARATSEHTQHRAISAGAETSRTFIRKKPFFLFSLCLFPSLSVLQTHHREIETKKTESNEKEWNWSSYRIVEFMNSTHTFPRARTHKHTCVCTCAWKTSIERIEIWLCIVWMMALNFSPWTQDASINRSACKYMCERRSISSKWAWAVQLLLYRCSAELRFIFHSFKSSTVAASTIQSNIAAHRQMDKFEENINIIDMYGPDRAKSIRW